MMQRLGDIGDKSRAIRLSARPDGRTRCTIMADQPQTLAAAWRHAPYAASIAAHAGQMKQSECCCCPPLPPFSRPRPAFSRSQARWAHCHRRCSKAPLSSCTAFTAPLLPPACHQLCLGLCYLLRLLRKPLKPR
jgi:hypothetical protein